MKTTHSNFLLYLGLILVIAFILCMIGLITYYVIIPLYQQNIWLGFVAGIIFLFIGLIKYFCFTTKVQEEDNKHIDKRV